MIQAITNQWKDHRTLVLRGGLAALSLVVILTLLFSALRRNTPTVPVERAYRVKIEHVRSGSRVKLRSGEAMVYAGIRAPYPDEPFYEEARKRNAELVEGEKVRVRYDEQAQKDQKGRLRGYVFSNGKFINELLVKEGLAYVRLQPGTKRFSEQLLKAQSHAWKKRLGLWGKNRRPAESKYFGDPKYGNFHRPNCQEVPKIDPRRLVQFKNKRAAFDKGFAPCSECKP